MNSPITRSISSQVEFLEKILTPKTKLKPLALSDDNLLRKFRDFPFGEDWSPKRMKEAQSNDDCACMCGLPNKKYCMLTNMAHSREKADKKKIVWAPMSICKVFSSSTPTVPYSTADILYGNEVNGRSQGEDVRQNSFLDGERSKLKSKELDYPGNIRRPSSKSGTRKSLSIDTVSLDKDKEDQLKGLNSSLLPSTSKPPSHFRPNGIRSNILKGEQLYTAKQNGATNGKDPDDLVAMGTLWSPNNGQQNQQQQQSASLPTSVEPQRQTASRSNSLSNNTNTNSYPSKVTSSSSNVNSSMSSSNNTVSSQRKYPSNSIRPIVNVQNNVSGKKNNNLQKDEDPKYTDPMIGAPASFQQRIIELGALEGDTVRWERRSVSRKETGQRLLNSGAQIE